MESIVHYLKNPNWRSQHFWRKAIWRGMSRLGLTGLHALPVNRRWIEIHHRRMPMRNLGPAFAGMKIVQLSDLHYSPLVWQRYLIQYTHWINDLRPDLVVITGDLITGGYRYAHRIATILSHLKTRDGVICTLGNHDYSLYGRNGWGGEGERRADYLEKCLTKRGLIVLRNAAHHVCRPGCSQPLVLVGLDDDWSGHLDADRAFAGLAAGLPTICLNHNPANCLELMDHPWQWMLSGHTHGRQIATTRLGKAFYPHRRRAYTHGHYAVNGRHLYVNRGLAYGQRVLDWCRPEITVFKLEPQRSEKQEAEAAQEDHTTVKPIEPARKIA